MKKNKNINLVNLYNPICTLIYAALFTPFIYLLLTFFAGESTARPLCLMTFPLIAIGYSVQSLLALILKEGRKPISYSADITEKYFEPGKSLAPLIVGIILGIAAYIIASPYVTAEEYGQSFRMMMPIIVALLTVICVYTGAVLWFYPYPRLITIQTVSSIYALFFLNFIILAIKGVFLFDTQYTPWILYGCAGFALPVSALLLNQFFITKDYSGRVATAVNGQAQSYSLTIMGLVAIAAGVVFSLIFVVITGATNLIWEVIKIFAAILSVDRVEETGENPTYDELSSTNATGLPLWLNLSVITVFIILLILAAVFFCIRRLPSVREFLRKLSDIIKVFLHWLFSGKDRTVKQVKVENLSYLDKIDDTKGALRRKNRNTSVTYAELITIIAGMPSDRERIMYLYVVISDALRHRKYKIVKADTPREINRKIKKGEPITEFDRVTLAYEALRYGELDLSDDENKAMINRMCDIARSVCEI